MLKIKNKEFISFITDQDNFEICMKYKNTKAYPVVGVCYPTHLTKL